MKNSLKSIGPLVGFVSHLLATAGGKQSPPVRVRVGLRVGVGVRVTVGLRVRVRLGLRVGLGLVLGLGLG